MQIPMHEKIIHHRNRPTTRKENYFNSYDFIRIGQRMRREIQNTNKKINEVKKKTDNDNKFNVQNTEQSRVDKALVVNMWKVIQSVD